MENPSFLECQVFNEAGVSLSSSTQVLVYPKLQLKATNRIICAESSARAKKRNNSCVHIRGDIYCLVNKIVAVENTGYYIVARCLTPKPVILCNDPITNAQLQHIKVFDLPRYVHVLSNSD